MHKKPRKSAKPVAERWLRGTEITLRIIRRFAREIVKRFAPDKIILFGSQAYGTPHEDSDVDILVIMPARNELDQALRIRLAVEHRFSLDLLVRKPRNMAWRLAEGDSFLREITSKGKVLYEKPNAGVDPEIRGELGKRQRLVPGRPPVHDSVCFFCQQAAEKYLKALLEELGFTIPRTHDLEEVLDLLLPSHPHLRSLRRGCNFLIQFAVNTRYPGDDATKRQVIAALRWAGRIREASRALLGISKG